MPRYNISTQIPAEIRWLFENGGPLYPAAIHSTAVPPNLQETKFDTSGPRTAAISAIRNQTRNQARGEGQLNVGHGIAQQDFADYLYGAWKQYKVSDELKLAIDGLEVGLTPVRKARKEYLTRLKTLVDRNRSTVAEKLRTDGDLDTDAKIVTQRGRLEDVTVTSTRQLIANQMVKLGLIPPQVQPPPPAALIPIGQGDENHPEVIDFFAEREFYYLLNEAEIAGQAERYIYQALLDHEGLIKAYLKTRSDHNDTLAFLVELRARGNAAANPDHATLKAQLIARLGTVQPDAATRIDSMANMIFAEGEYAKILANLDARLGTIALWPALRGLVFNKASFIAGITSPPPPICISSNQVNQVIADLKSGNKTLPEVKALMGKLGIGGSPVSDANAKQLFVEIQFRRLHDGADTKLIPNPSWMRNGLRHGAWENRIKAAILSAIEHPTTPATTPAAINKLVTDIYEAKSVEDLKQTVVGGIPGAGPLARLGLGTFPWDPAHDNYSRQMFTDNVFRLLTAQPSTSAPDALPADSHLRRLLATPGAVAGGDSYADRFKAGIIASAAIVPILPAPPPPPEPFDATKVSEILRLARINPDNPDFNILVQLTPAHLLETPPVGPNPLAAIHGHPGYLEALGLRTADGPTNQRLAKEIYAEIQFEQELKRIKDSTLPAEHPSAIYRLLKSKKAEFIATISALPDGNAALTPHNPAVAVVPGSLRELFNHLYGAAPTPLPAPPGPGVAAPDAKDLQGNAGSILAAMQALGLAAPGIAAGTAAVGPGGVADLKNAEVFFKEAQFDRLKRTMQQEHKAFVVAGVDPAIQANLTASAITGALSDSLDTLMLSQKTKPVTRSFLHNFDGRTTVAHADNLRDELRALRIETKTTAQLATEMYNLRLIPADDAKLDAVKKQFADVQFRWLVKKAVDDQRLGRVGHDLYQALIAPAPQPVPPPVPPVPDTYPTRDAIKRFLSALTTHEQVENFYKMLSKDKNELTRYLMTDPLFQSIPNDDKVPSERARLAIQLVEVVTRQPPYFDAGVNNDKYLDLIENPFIREMLRKRGDILGTDEKLITRQIKILNSELREHQRNGTFDADNVNLALGEMFQALTTANPRNRAVYRGMPGVLPNAERLMRQPGNPDLAGPPQPRFQFDAPRQFPSLATVAPAAGKTLAEMQAAVNIFYTGFNHGGGAELDDDTVNDWNETAPAFILLRDMLIKNGLVTVVHTPVVAADWGNLRDFDFGTESYDELIALINPVLAAGHGKTPEQILTRQQFEKIRTYHRHNLALRDPDGNPIIARSVASMMDEWKSVSETGPRRKLFWKESSSYDRVNTLLDLVEKQRVRVHSAYPLDPGQNANPEALTRLKTGEESELVRDSLAEVKAHINTYELRLEQQKARQSLLFEEYKEDIFTRAGGLRTEADACRRLGQAPHNIVNQNEAKRIYRAAKEGSEQLSRQIANTEETLRKLKTAQDQLQTMQQQLTAIGKLQDKMLKAGEFPITAIDSKPLTLTADPGTPAAWQEIDAAITARRGALRPLLHAGPDAEFRTPLTVREGLEMKKPVISITANMTAIVDIVQVESKSKDDLRSQVQVTHVFTDKADRKTSSIASSIADEIKAQAAAGDPDYQNIIQSLTGVAYNDAEAEKKLILVFREYEKSLTTDLISKDSIKEFLMKRGINPLDAIFNAIVNTLYNACVGPDKCIVVAGSVKSFLAPSRKLCNEAWQIVNHYFATHPGATVFPIASLNNRVLGIALKSAFELYRRVHYKENHAKGIELVCKDQSDLQYKPSSWFNFEEDRRMREYIRDQIRLANPEIRQTARMTKQQNEDRVEQKVAIAESKHIPRIR